MPETPPIAFLDTETLGLDADHHAVWEVGLIVPVSQKVEETGLPSRCVKVTSDGTWTYMCWQNRVTDREISLAHPEALRISGFPERYQVELEAIDPDMTAEILFWATAGLHLAGNVVSFDEERLRRLLWRHGRTPAWHYHLIDVENLAVGFLAGRYGGREREATALPWDSDRIARAVGVDPDHFERHTALGDARWAKAMWEAVTEP